MATVKGFNSKFLRPSLSFPKLNKKLLASIINSKVNGAKYTHFSVIVHENRRLTLMTAVNIKGEAYNALSRAGSEPWELSEFVDERYQIDNRFYGSDESTFDQGHLVRRIDPWWGKRVIADAAEEDTFTWINCTPQHRKLNRDSGIWYQLEQHFLEQGVKNKIGDISVFTGSVIDNNDAFFKKQYRGTEVHIPLINWNTSVWKKEDGKIYAVGFTTCKWEWIKSKVRPLSQPAEDKIRLKDDYFEYLKFRDHKTYKVAIQLIEKSSGVSFNWKGFNFPYKADRAKTVKATPLKKVYPFAAVNNTYTRLSAARKKLVTPQSVKKALSKTAALSKKEVDKIINIGEAYLLKRYNIQNVTL